jgi:ankyrin repeat protein
MSRPLDNDTIQSFREACIDGEVQTVQSMINANGEEISRSADYNGWTPLHYVCESSNPSLNIVQLLVSIGGEAAVTAANRYGDTPLHSACESDNPSFDIVQLLVSIGGEAAVTAATRSERIPLHCACKSSNPSLDIVQLLVSIGGEAAVTATDRYGWTPLHCACNSSNPSFPVIEFLLETGGCSNWDEITPFMMRREATFQETPILHLAIATGAPPNVLRDFIDRFDNCIDVADSNGRYPLHNAIEAGLSWENGIQIIVEHVGEAGIIGNTDPVTGLFPFMLAAAGDAHDLSSVYELLRMDTNCCVAQTISYL